MTTIALAGAVSTPVAAGSAAAASTPTSDRGFTFGDLLDIVNPLQHIPIVSTIFRAITGDQIKTFPKIAGDMLFGGIAGFVSSVADTIFEKITGKNVGDTVLAWVEGEFSNRATDAVLAPPAALGPALRQPAAAAVMTPAPVSIVVPGRDALLLALTSKSIDQDLALRAASAYRSTLGVAGMAAASALH